MLVVVCVLDVVNVDVNVPDVLVAVKVLTVVIVDDTVLVVVVSVLVLALVDDVVLVAVLDVVDVNGVIVMELLELVLLVVESCS